MALTAFLTRARLWSSTRGNEKVLARFARCLCDVHETVKAARATSNPSGLRADTMVARLISIVRENRA